MLIDGRNEPQSWNKADETFTGNLTSLFWDVYMYQTVFCSTKKYFIDQWIEQKVAPPYKNLSVSKLQALPLNYLQSFLMILGSTALLVH